MITFKQHLFEMSKKEKVLNWLDRNKTRIKKELKHSKRAMLILDKAFIEGELTVEEKKFLKAKILDAVKLTIIAAFLSVTPGSVLIFPLLIKVMPGIVPDMFKSDKAKVEFKKD